MLIMLRVILLECFVNHLINNNNLFLNFLKNI